MDLGLWKPPYGERAGFATITQDIATAMRKDYYEFGMSNKKIIEKYKTTKGVVDGVIGYRTWIHE